MVFGLAGLGIFRKLDRYQIVDQTDKARRAALFQPREETAPFEVMVGDQQIDRRRRIAAQPRQQRPLAAGEKADTHLAGDLPDPAVLPHRIDLAAPRDADRADHSPGRVMRQ